MSVFKKILDRDIQSVFINTREFAEIHNIDGTDIPIVLDIDRLTERRDKAGVSSEEIYFFVATCQLPKRPIPENIMMFDRRMYRITECPENNGVYEIALERQNTGG